MDASWPGERHDTPVPPRPAPRIGRKNVHFLFVSLRANLRHQRHYKLESCSAARANERERRFRRSARTLARTEQFVSTVHLERRDHLGPGQPIALMTHNSSRLAAPYDWPCEVLAGWPRAGHTPPTSRPPRNLQDNRRPQPHARQTGQLNWLITKASAQRRLARDRRGPSRWINI